MTVTQAPMAAVAAQSALVDERRYDADVVVVGAGPAGSSAAYWLAERRARRRCCWRRPRSRARRSAATASPRAAPAPSSTWASTSARSAGWLHNRGLRVIGGGLRLHLDWPELTSFPTYGLVRPARRPRRAARPAGRQGRCPAARADRRSPSRCSTAPAGSSACRPRPAPDKEPVTYRAPLVLACEGVSRQARPAARPAPQRQAPAGRRGAPLLHQPPDPRRLPRVVARAVGRPMAERVRPAARLRLDLRHGRRHGQRRPRRAELQRRLPEDRLPRDAHPLARQHPGGVGAARGRTPPARPAAPRCRWASTARRTTRAGCCSSATPAVRSTRSTARASRTRWSPASFAAEAAVQALARPTGPQPRARAARLPRARWRPSGAPTTASAACS